MRESCWAMDVQRHVLATRKRTDGVDGAKLAAAIKSTDVGPSKHDHAHIAAVTKRGDEAMLANTSAGRHPRCVASATVMLYMCYQYQSHSGMEANLQSPRDDGFAFTR